MVGLMFPFGAFVRANGRVRASRSFKV